MVLEHLISTKRLERTPALTFILSFIFVSVAVLITYYFYPKGSSMFIIELVVMPAIPFFLRFIVHEEKEHEIEAHHKHNLWRIYKPVIELYGIFFIGIALSFAFWAAALPQDVSAKMFADQRAELGLLTGAGSSQFTYNKFAEFGMIFSHNLGVLSLMLIFSFLYSIGAIFLLVWNASLLGIFLESFIRELLPFFANLGAGAFPAAFSLGCVKGLLMILPHGIFEIPAFFIASLAGGILSVALEHRMYRKRELVDMMADVGKLVILSVVLLAVAAFVESIYI